MKKTTKTGRKIVEKKNNVEIDNKTQIWTKNLTQTKEDGCTKGLNGSRYELMGVLDGELEGNQWRTARRR